VVDQQQPAAYAADGVTAAAMPAAHSLAGSLPMWGGVPWWQQQGGNVCLTLLLWQLCRDAAWYAPHTAVRWSLTESRTYGQCLQPVERRCQRVLHAAQLIISLPER
jgi:hypothetical protein